MPAGQAAINPLGAAAPEGSPAADGTFAQRVSLDSSGQPAFAGCLRRQSAGGVADGTLLVARIGFTTADSISRAIASLGQDGILGIVANGML